MDSEFADAAGGIVRWRRSCGELGIRIERQVVTLADGIRFGHAVGVHFIKGLHVIDLTNHLICDIMA